MGMSQSASTVDNCNTRELWVNGEMGILLEKWDLRKIDIRIAREIDRIDCREYSGAEMPKRNDMVLSSILRSNVWHQKKLNRK